MKKQATMSIAAAIQGWLCSESRSFTALCGERFSRAEVIMTGMGIAALTWAIVVGVWVANWLAGGAA